MDKETIKIIKSFLRKLSKKIKVEKAILFGSRARGDNFKSSDFDVIIISDDFKKTNFLDRIPFVLKYWNYSYDLEPICYTKEEFEKKKKEVSFRKIIKEGKQINF